MFGAEYLLLLSGSSPYVHMEGPLGGIERPNVALAVGASVASGVVAYSGAGAISPAVAALVVVDKSATGVPRDSATAGIPRDASSGGH